MAAEAAAPGEVLVEDGKLQQKIEEVEKTLKREIVPCVIEESDHYIGSNIFIALIFLLIISTFFKFFSTGNFQSLDSIFLFQALSLGLGFLCGNISGLKRFVIGKSKMEEEVFQKSLEVLYYLERSYPKTSIVLVLVSKLEKRIQILCNDPEVKSETLEEGVRAFTCSTEKLSLRLEEVVDRLSQVIPPDKRELEGKSIPNDFYSGDR